MLIYNWFTSKEIVIFVDCFLLPVRDPLLLSPGALIQIENDLIGVELGSGKEAALLKGELFMYLDVQPSRRGRDHFRFKILKEEYIYVEATLKEFKKWFRVVYRPVWCS